MTDRLKQYPMITFRILTGAILIAIVAVFAVKAAEGQSDAILPIEFRIAQMQLSDLPVQVDKIESCSCWFGPRDQAQRKYKFRVVNNSDRVIDIGGGLSSAVRLIVAYPNHREPKLTMPAPSNNMLMQRFGSPPDMAVPVSKKIIPVKASEIKDANAFFGVPGHYSVWALPSSPNKIAEFIGQGRGEGSYPTIVDKTHLLPGEEYWANKRGHGTWTFYIPLPHRFASQFSPNSEPILPRRLYEKYVVFVGIGIFRREADDVADLLGFAPAPSENAFAYPGEL